MLVLCGLSVSLALPAVQASEQARGARGEPADVVYTFNKVRAAGARDMSNPTHHRLVLQGDWERAVAANGKRDAIAFQARSRGVIKRSGALVPKRRAFAAAMTIKLRRLVGNDTPNIAQLGFYGDKGQWKVEVLPNDGRIRFRVKGSKGARAITSRRGIDDGQFHRIVAFRTHSQIGLILDGHKRTRNARLGTVSSSRNITIANKHTRSASDQFRGTFDYFAIAIGHQAVARASQRR